MHPTFSVCVSHKFHIFSLPLSDIFETMVASSPEYQKAALAAVTTVARIAATQAIATAITSSEAAEPFMEAGKEVVAEATALCCVVM